jgi:Holliday junction resolvase RusA-like endonuclease
VFRSSAFKKYSVDVGYLIKPQLREQGITEPITGPCRLAFYVDKSRHDLDNLLAAPCDVLQHNGVIKNDKQFYSIYATWNEPVPDDMPTIIVKLT